MKYVPAVYRKRIHGGFRIAKRDDGYWLIDTDDFNRWGDLGPITSRTDAVEYAWGCWEFKTGKRSRCPVWPDESAADRQDALLDDATHAAARVFAESGIELSTDELYRLNDFLTEMLGPRVPQPQASASK